MLTYEVNDAQRFMRTREDLRDDGAWLCAATRRRVGRPTRVPAAERILQALAVWRSSFPPPPDLLFPASPQSPAPWRTAC